MKKSLLYCCLLQFLVIATYAQFPKSISTHPDFPVNDEFLLRHIEELTLRVIDIQKELNQLKSSK